MMMVFVLGELGNGLGRDCEGATVRSRADGHMSKLKKSMLLVCSISIGGNSLCLSMEDG